MMTPENPTSEMADPGAIKRFALAGNARITLRSKKTGARYAYRVNAAKAAPNSPAGGEFFVSLITGSDNDNHYRYLGTADQREFRLTRKSPTLGFAKPTAAFRFFYDHVIVAGHVPEALEVYHEGRCGQCGRALTAPESIDRGIGPECWEKMSGSQK